MSEEGRKLVKKATKLLQPSVFAMRMKPDWDQATPLFEEAARIFSRCRAFKDAQYSFERASEGQQRLGSELHAVRHLESAAECATKDKRHEDAFHLYEQGFTTFAGIGKVAMGAKVLANGAKSLMEEGKSELAEKLYDVALEAVEDDGGVDSSSAGTLVLTSQDLFNSLTKSKCFSSLKVFFFCFFFFKLTISFYVSFFFSLLFAVLVESKRYEKAAANELRYAAFVNSLSSFNSSRSLCRAYLQAIVLNLVAGNGQEVSPSSPHPFSYLLHRTPQY